MKRQSVVRASSSPRLLVCGVVVAAMFSHMCGASGQGAGETIDMRDYWPQPAIGEVQVVRFDSGRFGIYRRLDDHFVLDDEWHIHTKADDPSTLAWSGRWHYRIDGVDGMVEFQDDAPGRTPVPLRRGYELRWGRLLRVGETIEHKVMFEGASAPFGYHRLTVVAHYPSMEFAGTRLDDVVQLRDIQSVCRGGTASSGSQDQPGPLDCPKVSISQATYYLARGWGIVRIDDAILDGTPNFVRSETMAKRCRIHVGDAEIYCR